MEEFHAPIPYSFRLARTGMAFAYGGVLHPFSTNHNLTFDTVSCPEEAVPLNRREGAIFMSAAYACADPNAWCYVSPMTLRTFISYCTLSFSKPVQSSPFKLFSLATPLLADRLSQGLLLGSCICMALTLMNMTGKWNVSETLLAVMSGLVGKSVSLRGNSRHLLLYTAWLLFIGFVSLGYTNLAAEHRHCPKDPA